MPAYYSTPDAYTRSPVGRSLESFWTDLEPGEIERLIAGASDAADAYTHRKLGAPPRGLTIAASASVGASSLDLDSAVNIYPTDLLVFDRTGEMREVEGADVPFTVLDPGTSATPAGTVYLTAPLGDSYEIADTVSIYRQDRYLNSGQRTSPIDNDGDMTQESQIAAMHRPKLIGSGNARRIFLSQYPVWSCYKAFESLPWTATEVEITFLDRVHLDLRLGILRLPIGIFNPDSTYWRVSFIAGYRAMPYDIREAVHLLVSAEIARQYNPSGGSEVSSEGLRIRMTRERAQAGASAPVDNHTEAAQAKLDQHTRRGR